MCAKPLWALRAKALGTVWESPQRELEYFSAMLMGYGDVQRSLSAHLTTQLVSAYIRYLAFNFLVAPRTKILYMSIHIEGATEN
jgi:hypothetical protein